MESCQVCGRMVDKRELFECDYCGKIGCDDCIKYDVDPYNYEIENDNTKVHMCEVCEEQRRMSI